MSKKKVSKASTRRIFTLGLVAICFVFYFLFTAFEYLISISKLSNEKKELTSELNSLKEEEKNYKNDIVKLNDPDYIAKYARENYQYSKDGEYIIQISTPEKIESNNSNEKWDLKLVNGIIFSVMIFLFFLKKSIK